MLPSSRRKSPPPVRPSSWETTNFAKQNFVRWFHPVELVRAGIHALLADLFGSYADRRELQAALNPPVPAGHEEHDYSTEADGGDFWFDFVSDVGDGFNATYSIASLLGRERLALKLEGGGSELTTPRGRFLLMGGDEVYPTASRQSYLDRTVGPYRAALPYEEDESRAPHLFALPGNHDWYDGLSAFLKQFAQPRWVGAWSTRQRRSYFVIKLPHRYWLWAIDIQLRADVDAPQISYFDAAAERLQAGDRVILATAEPSWVKAEEGAPAGFENLQLVMRKVAEQGAEVICLLSGDSHHYARYRAQVGNMQFITAGGGGAFLHGTHALPARIPFVAGTGAAARTELELAKRFPCAADSRRLIRERVLGFPTRNRAFVLVWAAPWLVVGWSLLRSSLPPNGHSTVRESLIGTLAATLTPEALFTVTPVLPALAGLFVAGSLLRLALPFRDSETGATTRDARAIGWRMWIDVAIWAAAGSFFTLALAASEVDGRSPLGVLLGSLFRSPGSALIVGSLVVCSAAYVSRPFDSGMPGVRFLLGCAHAGLYVLSFLLPAVLLGKLALGVTQELEAQAGPIAAAVLSLLPAFWVVLTALLAAPLCALLFAGFLWFAGQYRRALLNDAFSAIGVEDFKNFLRVCIGSDGALNVFAIGVREVPKDWRFNPNAAANQPFIIPKTGDVDYELIENVNVPPPARRSH